MENTNKEQLANGATTYNLKKPIIIGRDAESKELKYIEEIKFREPTAGDLRGLSLVKVFESDMDSWNILLSRICEPKINPELLKNLGLKDMCELIGKVLNFLQ